MIRQIRRFAGVGLIATLAHVTTALWVASAVEASPQAANLAGFAVALSLSYVGHAYVTFGRTTGHAAQFARFATLSLTGLALSGGITAIICSVLGGSLLVAQVVVAMTVPMLTFVGSRFWAFAG